MTEDPARSVRNPIDQRHANPKATDCPVFWRNFGIPFAWFLALYPWATILCLIVFEIAKSINIFAFPEGVEELVWLQAALGNFFLPVIGMALCSTMQGAVKLGLVQKRTFWVCLLLILFSSLPGLFIVAIVAAVLLTVIKVLLLEWALMLQVLLVLLAGRWLLRLMRSKQ